MTSFFLSLMLTFSPFLSSQALTTPQSDFAILYNSYSIKFYQVMTSIIIFGPVPQANTDALKTANMNALKTATMAITAFLTTNGIIPPQKEGTLLEALLAYNDAGINFTKALASGATQGLFEICKNALGRRPSRKALKTNGLCWLPARTLRNHWRVRGDRQSSRLTTAWRSLLLLVQLEIDGCRFLRVKYVQRFLGAGSAVVFGFQLVFDVGTESREMIGAVGIRDERTDLQRLVIFQLNHRFGHRMAGGIGHNSLDRACVGVVLRILSLAEYCATHQQRDGACHPGRLDSHIELHLLRLWL